MRHPKMKYSLICGVVIVKCFFFFLSVFTVSLLATFSCSVRLNLNFICSRDKGSVDVSLLSSLTGNACTNGFSKRQFQKR